MARPCRPLTLKPQMDGVAGAICWVQVWAPVSPRSMDSHRARHPGPGVPGCAWHPGGGSVSLRPCLPPQALASASAAFLPCLALTASGPLNLLFPLFGRCLLPLRPLQSPRTHSSKLYPRQPLEVGPPCWHALEVPVEDRGSAERWGCSEHQPGRGAGLGLLCPEGWVCSLRTTYPGTLGNLTRP